MFIMSSRGPENFLLYITARIRTFLKPGTVRVRKKLYTDPDVGICSIK